MPLLWRSSRESRSERCINICDRLVAPRGWLAKIYCNGALASQTFYNLTQHSSHRTHDTHHLLAP